MQQHTSPLNQLTQCFGSQLFRFDNVFNISVSLRSYVFLPDVLTNVGEKETWYLLKWFISSPRRGLLRRMPTTNNTSESGYFLGLFWDFRARGMGSRDLGLSAGWGPPGMGGPGMNVFLTDVVHRGILSRDLRFLPDLIVVSSKA